MFYPLLTVLIVWILSIAARRGASEALWRGWAVAMMLLPTWILVRVSAINFDLRSGAAIAVLAGFVIAPQPGCWRRFTLGDGLAVGLFGVIITSQFLVGPFTPLTAPEILRKWLLPYLMGRLFLRSTDDLDRALPIFSKVVLILSLFSIFESVSKVHVVNLALGKSFGLLEQGEGYRMGLKRAQGPLDHPIFFGMMLVMLFPWAVEAFRRARRGEGPAWWRWLPVLAGGALFGTVSRGPQLAGLFTFGATLFFRRPAWRLPVILVALSLGGLAMVFSDVLMDLSAQISGEKDQEARLISIDDEEVEYTGTNHRVLLFSVYREAMQNAGLFGYGYSLRGVPLDPEHADRFGSIDNHYMLFLLQHGWLAVGGFLTMGICSVLYLMRAAWNPENPEAGIAGSLAGAMVAVLVLLVSVWFAPDFGTVWLFNAGLASALHTLPRTKTYPAEEGLPAAAAIAPRPRLLRLPHAPARPTGTPA